MDIIVKQVTVTSHVLLDVLGIVVENVQQIVLEDVRLSVLENVCQSSVLPSAKIAVVVTALNNVKIPVIILLEQLLLRKQKKLPLEMVHGPLILGIGEVTMMTIDTGLELWNGIIQIVKGIKELLLDMWINISQIVILQVIMLMD